jgi:hypothetical protein
MLGKPLPANLKILPDCVPASILIFTFPPTVLISLVVPKAASEKKCIILGEDYRLHVL